MLVLAHHKSASFKTLHTVNSHTASSTTITFDAFSAYLKKGNAVEGTIFPLSADYLVLYYIQRHSPDAKRLVL